MLLPVDVPPSFQAGRPPGPRMPALLVAVFFSAAAVATGQSLGEAAAREKERRTRIQGSGKSFTDSDLQQAGMNRQREEGPSSGVSDGGGRSPAATPDDSEVVQEAKRRRGLELKTRLARVNAQLAAATARLKEAQRQWDAVYLSLSGYPLEQAAAHLAAARKDVARLTQERDDIETAARREDIPPGYMR